MKEYFNLNTFLKNHGIEYLVGFNLSGVAFMCVCVVLGAFGLMFSIVVGSLNVLNQLFAFFIGLVLPFVILVISNHADNDNMLVDIKTVFQMLKIQVYAGIYIIDALENCSTLVKSKRFKMALNRLISEIYMSKNVEEALDDFNEKFSNTHIDTLVIILKQSMESGYSVSNLDSAFEQVLDVEKAINVKIENSVERKVQVMQVLFMAGIIAIAAYCSIVEFKGIFEVL